MTVQHFLQVLMLHNLMRLEKHEDLLCLPFPFLSSSLQLRLDWCVSADGPHKGWAWAEKFLMRVQPVRNKQGRS